MFILVLLDLSAAFATINHHITSHHHRGTNTKICIKGSALSPSYVLEKKLFMLMMNHRDLKSLVIESHEVLCLGHYYLFYKCFL